MKACMVCLGFNMPLCLMGMSEAKTFLNDILVKHGFQKLRKNHYVCLLCKSSVIKSYNFIQRVLKAQTVLKAIVDRDKTVTYLSLAAIDRSKLNLDINLSYENIYNIEILNNAYTEAEIEEDTLVNEEIIKDELPNKQFDPITVNTQLIDEIVCNNDKNKIALPKKYFTDEEHESDAIDLDETSNEMCLINGDNPEIAKEVIYVTEHEHVTDHEHKADHEHEHKTEHVTAHEHETEQECQLVKECFNENIKKISLICADKNKEISTTKKCTTVLELTDDDENMSLDTLSETNSDSLDKYNKTKKTTLTRQTLKKTNKYHEKDDDYKPDSSSESDSTDDDSDYELYDDNGKRIKKPDTRVYPMDCDECEYEIQSKMDHFHHYLIYHRDKKYPYGSENRFVCHVCGNIKTTLAHYQQHLLTHGEKKIICDICGKKYHNKMRLYQHKAVHSKTLVCDYCKKGFSDRVQLIRHIRTHTGEKPFPCHICGARFAHLGNVGVHIRSFHQHQPIIKPKSRKKLTELNNKKKPKKHQTKSQKGKKKKGSRRPKEKIHEKSDEEDSVPLTFLK